MKLRINRETCSLFLLASLAVLFGSSSLIAEPRKQSIKRVEDHIVFTGADVTSLIGVETVDLHLYVCGASGLAAVPFQVDKRDKDGRMVFPDEKLLDPARDGTLLDDNDELVFMVKDAGDRCQDNVWVDKAERGVEIELTDPLDNGIAWAYLFHRPGAKAPETDDYVSYRTDDDREHISSGQYEIGQPWGSTSYDIIRLRRPDGEWGEDVLDLLRIEMRARLLNNTLPVYIPEQEIKCRTFGVIDGPVRVIRYEMDFVHIKVINLNWKAEYFQTYYFNGNISPVEFSIPVNLIKLFLDISFSWALDFNENIIGSKVINPANPEGIILDGKQDQDIDDEKDVPYTMVSGPQGSMIDIMVLGRDLGEIMDRVTYVREDLEKKKTAEENHPGQLLSGYRMKTSTNLKKGSYTYFFYHYYPYPFTDRTPREILDMIENPVKVTARPITPP